MVYLPIHLPYINQLNVGKSTSPIDPMRKYHPQFSAISTPRSNVEDLRGAAPARWIDFLGDPVLWGMVGPPPLKGILL